MKYLPAFLIVIILGVIAYLILVRVFQEPRESGEERKNAPDTSVLESRESGEKPKSAPDILVLESRLADGLIIADLKVGTGAEAKNGNILSVHYLGTLENGAKFDSSYDRGAPFSFALGAREVIAGWDEGLLGMKVGGKRKLIIPPLLAYGERGVGAIPPNSTLIFEVELLGIK